MNKCQKCGREFLGRFCPECGTEFQEVKICPECGTKITGSGQYCNVCGSFLSESIKVQIDKPVRVQIDKKQNAIIKWLKSHLKIVIAVSLVLLVVIILSCTIPACIATKNDGIYYKLDRNNEIDPNNYYILKSEKWECYDGSNGIFKIKDDKINFYENIVIFEDKLYGDTKKIYDGIFKDYVLKINNNIFISKKHKHSYLEWVTVLDPTYKDDGLMSRTCYRCSYYETKAITATGTPELKYVLNKDKKSYMVILLNSSTEREIYIPSEYAGMPVSSINKGAFRSANITEITIPESITSIGDLAFCDCTKLSTIYYKGTITQWNAVQKGEEWNKNTHFTLICDGVQYKY